MIRLWSTERRGGVGVKVGLAAFALQRTGYGWVFASLRLVPGQRWGWWGCILLGVASRNDGSPGAAT